MATTALLPGGRRGIGASAVVLYRKAVGSNLKLCSCCVSVGKINRLSF